MSLFPQVTEDLVQRYDAPGPRYTSFPTVPQWTGEFGPAHYAHRLETAGRAGAQKPLSIYLHLPFCESLCTYCGCNVIIAKDRRGADPYLDHLDLEMQLAGARLGERRTLSQIHWGGGTPTFLEEAQIERLWKIITRHFRVLPGAEVSVEIHPGVTTPAQLSLLRALGFTRISLGVQDFDAAVLEGVNRRQTEAEVRGQVQQGRALGFSGVNFDLIYGLPGQTPERWRTTLEKVLHLRPDRVAVYSFAFVPDVKHNQRKIDPAELPRGTRKLGLFGMAYDAFTGAGYRQIGMDHFALPEDDLSRAQERRTLGRNFQGYTVLAADDTVAFGATGISDVAGAYAQNVRPLQHYYRALDRGELATERGIALTQDDMLRRKIINQLMCNFWVDLGPHGATCFDRELERLRELERDGLVKIDGAQIELTPLGRLLVRNVAMVFDPYLRHTSGRSTYSRTV